MKQTEQAPFARNRMTSVHAFGRYDTIGTFSLPLEVPGGRVASFRFDYFEFSERRYQTIYLGELREADECLVRLQSQCVWGNFGSRQCDCGWQFAEAKRLVLDEGTGLIIFAYDQIGKGIGVRNHNLVNAEAAIVGETDILVDGFKQCGFPVDDRNFRDMVDILRHYNLRSIRMLTNHPGKIATLKKEGFGVTRIPFIMPFDKFNRDELTVKAEKAGHLIEVQPES